MKDKYTLDEIQDTELERDFEAEAEAPPKKTYAPVRKGSGFGVPISTDPCPFCNGAGTVVKTRGRILCSPCQGLGTKGGAGKANHPVTPDMIRPSRSHTEEKPIED
jgi:hypothetical protein